MGLLPDQFHDLTFQEFATMLAGRRESEAWKQQQAWERCRWQTWVLLKPHTKRNAFPNPKSLGAFPWEKPAQTAPVRQDEQIVEMLKSFGPAAEKMLKAMGQA